MIVMAERRLKFNEAVRLLCNRYRIGDGEAHALVRDGVRSREIRCAWTSNAIVHQEHKAPRSSANNWNARFAADMAAAHDRAAARLRLLTEVESGAFTDQIIAGNIVLTESDLLSWYSRNREPPAAAARPVTPLASKAKIREILAEYRRTLPDGANPSMAAAQEFVRDKNVVGHQDEIRSAYRKLFGHPRVGRPPRRN